MALAGLRKRFSLLAGANKPSAAPSKESSASTAKETSATPPEESSDATPAQQPSIHPAPEPAQDPATTSDSAHMASASASAPSGTSAPSTSAPHASAPSTSAAAPASASKLKRVLVTGGSGYIGSHVVHALQATRAYKVVSLDNFHNAHPGALARVEALAREALPADASADDVESASVDHHKCDLTRPDEIDAVFARYGEGGIWGVVHIAAYKAVGESVEFPLLYYQNNVAATVALCQAMARHGCARMVYSSSATVYGTPPEIPIPERTRLQADSPYGRSKVMCETLLADVCAAEPARWRALALRYFNPAGAHPSGRIGEDPRGRPGNLLPLLAHMAVGRVAEDTLKVFGNDYPTPDGTCVRDYIHVMDLAAGHVLALGALADDAPIWAGVPADAPRFRAYNLGKGRGSSVLQIVEAMRAATGFGYKTSVVGRRRGDVPDLTADPALAEKELGFRAPRELPEMCRDLWNWQSKNPEGYDTPARADAAAVL